MLCGQVAYRVTSSKINQYQYSFISVNDQIIGLSLDLNQIAKQLYIFLFALFI